MINELNDDDLPVDKEGSFIKTQVYILEYVSTIRINESITFAIFFTRKTGLTPNEFRKYKKISHLT